MSSISISCSVIFIIYTQKTNLWCIYHIMHLIAVFYDLISTKKCDHLCTYVSCSHSTVPPSMRCMPIVPLNLEQAFFNIWPNYFRISFFFSPFLFFFFSFSFLRRLLELLTCDSFFFFYVRYISGLFYLLTCLISRVWTKRTLKTRISIFFSYLSSCFFLCFSSFFFIFTSSITGSPTQLIMAVGFETRSRKLKFCPRDTAISMIPSYHNRLIRGRWPPVDTRRILSVSLSRETQVSLDLLQVVFHT